MKHRVTSLVQTGAGTWKATLESWEGCHCSAKTKTVLVRSEKRPSLRDVLDGEVIGGNP